MVVVGRLGSWSKLEHHILARFQRQAEPFLTSRPTTTIDWLVLGQHHGLPTRLLDWTENPLVALYFALAQDVDADAAVWMMEPRYVVSTELDIDALESIQVYFPRALDSRIVFLFLLLLALLRCLVTSLLREWVARSSRLVSSC